MPFSRGLTKKREGRSKLWPDLRYGPNGECQLFFSEAEVPEGWTKNKDDKYEVNDTKPPSKDELVKALQDRGIQVNPIWGIAHLQKVLDDNDSIR
jgi:hypothetical protein